MRAKIGHRFDQLGKPAAKAPASHLSRTHARQTCVAAVDELSPWSFHTMALRKPRRCNSRAAANINVVLPEPRNPPTNTTHGLEVASIVESHHFATSEEQLLSLAVTLASSSTEQWSSGELQMSSYAVPVLESPTPVAPGEVLLVASGDLANRRTRSAGRPRPRWKSS